MKFNVYYSETRFGSIAIDAENVANAKEIAWEMDAQGYEWCFDAPEFEVFDIVEIDEELPL